MDSLRVVKALHDVDPGFVELCKTLFGDAVHAEDVWEFIYTRDGISKMSPAPSDVSTPARANKRGKLVSNGQKLAAPSLPNRKRDVRDNTMGGDIDKADGFDVVWSGQIEKADDDKRQVFGWASIVEIDGKPVVDRQGDWITPDEIEKAAYDYVLKSRKGGHQHRRDGDQPFHAADMIESFVLTPEKISKMGLPEETPVGWWVGYKVHDDEAWSKVKKGEVTGFSIHGRGKRKEVDA
ncbi:Phage-like element PBSX protein, XkdF [uncultured Caudovirales phage]|uniref:Phage-like element PBSX protein, XkdF n=1 Tax=uncultured Caudovirales phage TaxID=2100421 RepID=A0A6J5RLI7_9CAUD|nr:Phage-like element PBSX protein, XkdF [uncultured Caudovirales phage]